MKPMLRKSEFAAFAIVVLSFAIAVYFYQSPLMPDVMPSHWNAAGQVDGYMDKFWGIFLMPIISAVMFALFLAIPRIEPLRENLEKFRREFGIFVIIIMAFMVYIYLLTILWALGKKFNMVQFLMPALAVLLYYAGVLLKKAKRNWFVGIRTPWTLSSDRVWDKTHKRGGAMFKVVALFTAFGIFMPEYAIWLLLVPVLAVAVYLAAYSYLEYKKETGKGKKK
ncbi:MAG: DUF1648 domain-containing protein [Candidatus Diapherotrites archaeon]